MSALSQLVSSADRRLRTGKAFRSITALATFVAVAAGLAAADLRRATINVHAGPGGPLVNEINGQPLASGQEVRIGWMPNSFDFAGKAANPVEVSAVWQSLGTTTTRSLFGQAGRYTTTVETTDRNWVNRQLYLWILRSADGQPIKSDYSNVSAHALVTSGSRPNWKVPAPENLPPANTVLLALAEAETAYVGIKTSTSLTVAAVAVPNPGMTYAEWAAVTIGAGDKAALSDIDGDGRVNLFEFFLGGNPTVRDYFQPVVVSVKEGGKTYLEMTFRFPRDVRGVTWTVEASSDTKIWTAVPNVVVTDRGDGTNQVVARDAIAVEDAGGKRFLRLNVRL